MRSRPLRFLRRSWDTVTLSLLVSGWLVASLGLSQVAAWIPRMVLLITLGLLIVQLAVEFREVGPENDELRPPGLPPLRPTGPVVVVTWIAGLMFAVLLLGTVPGSMAFGLAYLRLHARESWLTSGAVALLLGASVQLIFGVLLRAQLHSGWLLNLLV
jgi:hypothetical protein